MAKIGQRKWGWEPGIQAIANTTEDLPPDTKHKTISRDYEYKRLGTVSLPDVKRVRS